MRDMTLSDLQNFEEWLYEKTGIRDVQAGMLKIGQTAGLIEMLRFADVPDPGQLSLRELEATLKAVGIPFPAGDGVLSPLQSAVSDVTKP